jgi:NADH:ubiquinone reductase (H+-translocating)
MSKHRVIVVGGGFAGVNCVRGLADADVDVTWIDKRNFHLFQPLLYQVATGGLSPGDITAPLRTIARDLKNVTTRMGDVASVDVKSSVVVLADGARLPFDSLVVATGASHSYFGKDGWEAHAPGLKSIEDATAIRGRVLHAFEQAELCDDDAERQAWLRFVVVGGGPTGVELAGALGELARHTMAREFRRINSNDAQILLLEGGPRLLSMYKESLSAYAVDALHDTGVAVLLRTKVVGIDAQGVDIEDPSGRADRIHSKTVLWAAGVKGSALGKHLAEQTGSEVDRAGRVIVQADLSLPQHPHIFVLGDLAHYATPAGPLPGIAPVAMQMGQHAAKLIAQRVHLRSTPNNAADAFRYFDKGSMAVIGRNQAVARVGVVNVSFGGFPAWLAWLFIHVVFLIGFENRLLVLLQWANHYFTRHRGARLIGTSLTSKQDGGHPRVQG